MQRKTKPWHSPEQPIKYGTVAVIQHLQNILEKTIVPSWISKPPAKFGEASAGSLTADEWRTMALVYLPLALVPLWGQGSQHPSPDIAEKYQHVLNHTMDLLAAVHLAGLHVVTPNRVAAYQEHMTNYVHNLPKLIQQLASGPIIIWRSTFPTFSSCLDLLNHGGVFHLKGWLESCNVFLPIINLVGPFMCSCCKY